jgi:GNAT superfamily N-acetyltransferase
MLNERTISIASSCWAARLGCSPDELFAEPFRIITHGGHFAGYCGAFALFRGDAALVSIPPDRADSLRALLADLSHRSSPGRFAAALASVATAVIGPAYIGYAPAVSAPTQPARAIGPDDSAAFEALRQLCDATEWEHGGSRNDDPSSGVFVDGQLVAVAGYEIRGGAVADIAIVTHPDFRGRGFGRAAVAHLALRAIAAGLLPQYRTLEENAASRRVAESLDFQPYATSVAVRLPPAGDRAVVVR